MSRQAGSIVWGIQSRAGYPSKRAGSRWRVCTAGSAKGQDAGNPPSSPADLLNGLAGVAGLEPATPGFGDLKIPYQLVLDGAVCAAIVEFFASAIMADISPY